jgi:hypothetical protein
MGGRARRGRAQYRPRIAPSRRQVNPRNTLRYLVLRRAALRLEDTSCRWRIVGELCRRPNGAGYEIAAAVRASPVKLVLGAVGAERALERADHGVGRLRRQVLVAAFAIGAEFEHLSPRQVGSVARMSEATSGAASGSIRSRISLRSCGLRSGAAENPCPAPSTGRRQSVASPSPSHYSPPPFRSVAQPG